MEILLKGDFMETLENIDQTLAETNVTAAPAAMSAETDMERETVDSKFAEIIADIDDTTSPELKESLDVTPTRKSKRGGDAGAGRWT
jgi:hypothetical protein